MKEKLPKILYISALVIIFIIAVTARLKGYLSIRPIWLDEVYVFVNIESDINPFSVLKAYQIMPPLFLITERLIYRAFGMHELVLRFFPLMTSIIAIPLFYYFSKIFLEKKWSIIAANFLFAINIFLIYFAQECKQYSSDVMWFLLIFIMLNKISIKNLSRNNITTYIALSSLIPFFSTPAYFAVGAWVIRELLLCRKAREFLNLAALQLPASVLTCLYFNFLLKQYSVFIKIFSNVWSDGFITNNLYNNFKIIENNVKYFFTPNTHYELEIILIIIGLIILVKNFKLKENMFLIFTICFMLLFSYLKIYPFEKRIILYAIPIAIVLAAKLLDYISLNKKLLSLIITTGFLYAFSGYEINYIAKCYTEYATNARFKEVPPNSKELVRTLASEYKPTDTVVCNKWSRPEYYYYSKYYNFNPNKVHYLYLYFTNPERIKKFKQGKYWLVFTREYNKELKYSDSNYIEFCKNFKILSIRDFNSAHLIYAEKE